MQFYTLAAKINKKIEKDVGWMTTQYEELGQPTDDIRELVTIREMKTFRKNTRLGIQLMLEYKEIATEMGLGDPSTKNYFITIRPDESKINFDSFYAIVQTFTTRKCFKSFSASFEQKGVTDETLGQGFHVHIIANMTQRSKGEVLRDAQSTFKHCTTDNNVDVAICKNPKSLKQGYLINYESQDDHKAPTKEWDNKWRTLNGLSDIYEDDIPARIIEIS